MHTFIDNIITFSLRNKFFIFFCTTIAVIAGITSFIHTPIDAFPDVTNTKVTIITQWPGRSAEEIEKFITIPIEIAMNPVQKKTDIRSTTLFGLSVINVMFEDKMPTCRKGSRRKCSPYMVRPARSSAIHYVAISVPSGN